MVFPASLTFSRPQALILSQPAPAILANATPECLSTMALSSAGSASYFALFMISWILAATLATIAGTLYGLDKSFKPFTYLQILLPIFAAAIVGGLGNPIGAIAGGFVIAFSEVGLTFAYRKFLTYLVPPEWAPEGLVQFLSTDYKFGVSFAILVIVLLVRPTGIFRGQTI